MQIKNNELVLVGNFLNSLTLPAKVSRARTKLVKTLQERLTEYNDARQEIIKDHNGDINEKTGVVTFPDKEKDAANSEVYDLDNETPIIQAAYNEQFSTLKAYFEDWDGEVSAENANAYDVLFDALEVDNKE
ncbi:hypothetical protein ACJQWY_02160 [Weissella kandleri]|uniref:hypothetical protein n=1 Tax=Weissella kandleri TaxID=1616 RepID=UPI00387E431D